MSIETTQTQVLAVSDTAIHVITMGMQGAAGVGLPTGGSSGQWLTKSSSDDFDAEWASDATLSALVAFNTNGILTQTAADTFTGRTITGTANQITVTHGDGVSGNPTLSLPQDIHTSATPQFGYIGHGTAAVSTQAITALIGADTDKGLVVKAAAAQTANLAEFQNSSGTAYVSIGPDTIAANGSQNYLYAGGTFPASISAGTTGVQFTITGGASSNSNQLAFGTTMNAGYTGTGITSACSITNASASTGASYGASNATNSYRINAANYTINTTMQSATTGINCGIRVNVGQSSTANYGAWFSASTSGNSPALNVGVVGIALNATTNCAGYFALAVGGTSPPTYSNAALIADNGATTGDVFVARDNGAAVFTIGDGGKVTCCATNTAAGTTGAQTIHKASGTVNFAAGASSLVVTNNLVTTSSIVLLSLRTSDSTMKSVVAVPASGSFTITPNAVPTGETSVGFMVIN